MMESNLRRIVRLLPFLCLLLAMQTVSAVAQETLPPDLTLARDLFESGNYSEALATVEGYLSSEPEGRFNWAAQLLAGRCEVRMGRGLAAVQRAIAVIDRYGDEGPMAAQAYYLMATANQEMGDGYEAARALVELLDREPELELANTAREHLRELLHGPVAYRARSLLMLARTTETQDTLKAMFPASVSQPTLGLLIPQGKEEGGTGDQLQAGVQAELDEFQQTTGIAVNLEVRRTPDSAPLAVAEARNLIRNDGIWGLIAAGPEPLVVAAAVEAQAAGVPVILPGMRRPGLTALGPTTIQPEADWRREGEILAGYAIDSLRLRTFAIVAPYTDRGQETVTGFRSILADRDSTKLLALEWYFPEEGVSLSGQFQRIRTLGFRLQYEDTLLAKGIMRPKGFEMPPFPGDSLRLFVRKENIDSLSGEILSVDTVLVDTLQLTAEDSLDPQLMNWVKLRRIAPWDSARFQRLWNARMDSIRRTVEFKTGLIDSNAIQLSVFNGLFLPIDPGSIHIFAPQFAFYNFKTTRLGNDGWYDPDELYRQRQYVQDLLFTAPYRLDSTQGEMAPLRDQLRAKGIETVTPWHIRGYDSARLLLEPVAEGRVGPLDVGEGATHIDSLSLAAGMQRFRDRQMSGRNMWLLTYHGERVIQENLEARLDSLYPPVQPDSALFDPEKLGDLQEIEGGE